MKLKIIETIVVEHVVEVMGEFSKLQEERNLMNDLFKEGPHGIGIEPMVDTDTPTAYTTKHTYQIGGYTMED